jgi:two-component system LytT family response regulator
MAIRVLIVDDEPLARRRVRRLLAPESEIEIVGECGNGSDAVAAIEELAPDLVFLDVQMPELDGFDVLAAVDVERMPAIVFTTAFDEYAVRAFEVHAVDYLVKPFSRARFELALGRAASRLERRDGPVDERLAALLETLRAERARPERLVVKAGGRVQFVPVAEIRWIEAEGNYARVHAGETSHVVRTTLAGLASKLDPKRFLRIHRSTIVNVRYVRELRPWFRGDYVVVMRDGTELTLSRTYRSHVGDALGQSL